MQSLKREFQHHKDKISEYNIVMDTVSRTEGERAFYARSSLLSVVLPLSLSSPLSTHL